MILYLLPSSVFVAQGLNQTILLMAGQAFARLIASGELIGSAVLVVIGIALIVLAPAKESVERLSAPVA
jgi:hypothetical protein